MVSWGYFFNDHYPYGELSLYPNIPTTMDASKWVPWAGPNTSNMEKQNAQGRTFPQKELFFLINNPIQTVSIILINGYEKRYKGRWVANEWEEIQFMTMVQKEVKQ